MEPIVKYEFDRITLSDEGMDQPKLDALLRFNELHDNRYFDGIARGIKLKQYVGIIQVDGLTIEVLPKVDRHRSEETWREVLIQMLQVTGKLDVQTTGSAHVKRQNMNLLEIYFELFLKEVQYLIRSGLVKKYRKNTGNVKALKGKLEFSGNIRHNLIHKERFYTTHQVYDYDHKIHQVLAEALSIVEHFTKGTRLNDWCKRILLDFPAVKRPKITPQFLHSIQLDRKTAPYEKAQEIARLIILNYNPDIKSGREKMLSILFDMNKLWEEYVLVMLKKSTKNTTTEVNGQDTKKFWGKSRTIRPDIVIKKDEKTFVLDTKWKRPINRVPSIEDIRQMYTYARFWNAQNVVLLYPGSNYDGGYQQYHGPEDEVDHKCKIAYVNVLLDGKLNKNIGEDIITLLE